MRAGDDRVTRASADKRKSPGSGLSSQNLAIPVLSVLHRFTTVFGMGTGGSDAPLATRALFRYISVQSIQLLRRLEVHN